MVPLLMFVALLAGLLGSVAVDAPKVSAQKSSDEFTVMTRNLYLGADVGKALVLLPNISAAAQAMWDEVAATNFSKRVGALAADVVADRPIVLALQEATVWECLDASGQIVTIFDFEKQMLGELERQGAPYVVASANGSFAQSPGYAIPPINGATMVHDPATLRPIIGLDDAACGFRIADVLAVRADVADSVTAAGHSNYEAKVKVGGLLEIQRGYAWADMTIDGQTVRFVDTHLESLWSRDELPAATRQVRELIDDLHAVSTPVVVMGDLNMDPRDPRPIGAPNPAGQPEVSNVCADRSCNTYWSMIDAGFIDAGPDSVDPANATWGAASSLAGPDLARRDAAIAAGNDLGFTDRLDYVFVRGDVRVVSSSLVGREWPTGASTWECNAPDQILNTQRASGLATSMTGRCFATDHLGILATLALGAETGSGSTVGVPMVILLSAAPVLIVAAVIIVMVVRRRRRRVY